MAKPYFITGLDIGSAFIKALVAEKKQGEDGFQIVAQQSLPSAGIRRGIVIDVQKASEVIFALIKGIEEDAGKRIGGVYANIGGAHLFCSSSKGLVSVSRADQKISEEDVRRLMQAAQTISLPSNKEILEVFPKEFIVDGQGGVKDVLGMHGVRLEAEAVIIGAFSPYIKNSTQAILNAKLQLNDLIPSILAGAKAVLTYKEKELGVAVLDMGAGTSSLAVFEEGNLIHLVVFPIGSSHITNDIAICLKTDIDTAERIKLELGFLRGGTWKTKGARSDRQIKIEAGDDSESLVLSKKMLADIIEAREAEVFDEVGKELKKISRHQLLPAGVVLIGGGAKLPGLSDFAKNEFKLPCRIGKPQNFSQTIDDPSFAAVCGLVLEGAEAEEEPKSPFETGEGISSKLKRFFRIFIP